MIEIISLKYKRVESFFSHCEVLLDLTHIISNLICRQSPLETDTGQTPAFAFFLQFLWLTITWIPSRSYTYLSISVIEFLALDAMKTHIGFSRVVLVVKNICTFHVNPTLAHIALYPVFTVIGGLEIYLLAINTIALLLIALVAGGTQSLCLVLGIAIIRTIFIGASLLLLRFASTAGRGHSPEKL